VFYGDASRVDVLAAAGAGRAQAAVLTIDQAPAIDRAVAGLHSHFPELRMFVRGHDPGHRKQLTEWGATAVVPEAVEASLQLGAIVLAATGTTHEEAARIIDEFRRNDYAGLDTIVDEGP
jgi:CPA2 family monovalent cation:H+ antiporter-2